MILAVNSQNLKNNGEPDNRFILKNICYAVNKQDFEEIYFQCLQLL